MMKRIERVVGGTNYLVYGINAELISWLERRPEPLFGAVSSDKLLQAFASGIQDQREKHSTDIIESLWNSQPTLGPYPFLSTLSQFQFDRVFYANYRDHVCHQLKVYVLGTFIYDASSAVRDGLAKEFDLPATRAYPEFLRRWLAASVYHDIGYVIENEEVLEGNTTDAAKWSDTRKILNETLDAPVSSVKECSRWISKSSETAAVKRNRHRFAANRSIGPVSDLETWEKDGDLFQLLNAEATKSGVKSLRRRPALREYWEHARSSLGKHRGPFYDHGIASALLFLQTWKAYREQLRRLSLCREDVEVGAHSAKLRKLSKAVGAAEETVRAAAAAMALHNINPHQWDEQTIRAARLDLSRFSICLLNAERRTPLAFLLGVADSLQDWDRPRYRAANESDRNPLDQDLSISAKNDKILLHLPEDDSRYRRPEKEPGSRYSKAIVAMKEYLEPEAIDLLVGWADPDEPQHEAFDQLIAEVAREFAASGVYGPRPLKRRGIDRSYLARVGFQKMLHAAHRIDSRAASSNLWICASVERSKPLSLRSDEREGYFSMRQLIEVSAQGTVSHREIAVRYERSERTQLAAASQCLVENRVVIQSLDKTGFPSTAEATVRYAYHWDTGCQCAKASKCSSVRYC